jgi:hypothetical protein
MYPSNVLSAGEVTAIVVTVAVAMAIWLGAVFYAAREPRHRRPRT